MKLNFSNIANPVAPSYPADEITGTIHGLPVKVTRRLKGWDPVISISLDGVVLHEDTPNAEEKAEYNKLVERALDNRTSAAEARRAAVVGSAAFNKLFSTGK